MTTRAKSELRMQPAQDREEMFAGPSADQTQTASGLPEPNYYEDQIMSLKRSIEKGVRYFWTNPNKPWRRAIGEANGDLDTRLTHTTART